MRFPLLLCLLLAGCAGTTDPDTIQRRGAVELAVKSDPDAILRDIVAGGGPVLTAAMDSARIPDSDRPARVLQMQRDLGLYEVNPGALVVALMTYGN